MGRVLDYCRDDALACVRLLPPLRDDLLQTCGPQAMTNLTELFQPYALAMAETASKGLRFDREGWGRALDAAPRYRARLLKTMEEAGYTHDGEGLGQRGFARMVSHLGLSRVWPRTPTGMLRTRENDLEAFGRFPAIKAAYKLGKFDGFMGQHLGDLVDDDGRLRCGILPLAQRTSRNSTVKPNLTGVPAELRPLLLPDVGCKFVHFDFAQQEPGIAGHLSGDEGLLSDFADGDVYINLGRRMGLLTLGMDAKTVREIRKTLLKSLMLSIIYGKSAVGVARDLPCSLSEARRACTSSPIPIRG
jgi:DNA polymerase I-like protein with 3'-5' exonuclease and polymerase domains